jgi:putative transcriptional regulator
MKSACDWPNRSRVRGSWGIASFNESVANPRLEVKHASRACPRLAGDHDESGTKSMTKAKRDIGAEILNGIREIKAGRTGRVTTVPSIARTRENLGLSQAQFARLMGVSVRTLQEWEQGRRSPSGAARTLLLIANRNPKALLDVA